MMGKNCTYLLLLQLHLIIKNLAETKLKSFGLISLVEEVLIQSNTDFVVWLLVITFTMKEREWETNIRTLFCKGREHQEI